jgi:hypothetical protein
MHGRWLAFPVAFWREEFVTNNISSSFSFQNLQQIGQNGNFKKTLTLIFPHPLSGEGKGLPLQVCHLHPTPHVY